MKWNWEREDWPNFKYDTSAYHVLERKFLLNAGEIRGSMNHIPDNEKSELSIQLLTNEAYQTSKIEGDILDRMSLKSSIKKHFGLKEDDSRSTPGERGIAQMMTELYNNYRDILTHERLWHWHDMLMSGTRGIEVGRYRTHPEPMQIVSGVMSKRKVHFEAPPSEDVRLHMDDYVDWFNSSQTIGPLVRSGIAHLYFESIHPFEDGNGRIGRALSEKVLAQSLGSPSLIALSHLIEKNKKEYYKALHKNSFELQVDSWLEYYCQLVLDAQSYTQELINFIISKARFFDRFDDQLNDRQKKVMLRVFREGVEGFKGGLSADNYISISGTSRATATRDLSELVKMGALQKTGERRYTRYSLNLDG